ncbi:MAG: hypothetical protein JWN49_26 [Parcubacteria group bacterium]|nr:hypothetical protein [Parcubacteria group bacterium]
MRVLLIGFLAWGILIDSWSLYYVRIEGGDAELALQRCFEASFIIYIGITFIFLPIRRFVLKRGSYRQKTEFLIGGMAIWGSFLTTYHLSHSWAIILGCFVSNSVIRGRLFMGMSTMMIVTAIVVPYSLSILGGPVNDIYSAVLFAVLIPVSFFLMRFGTKPRGD